MSGSGAPPAEVAAVVVSEPGTGPVGVLVVGVGDVVVPGAVELLAVPVGVPSAAEPDEPQPGEVVDVPDSEEPLPDGAVLEPCAGLAVDGEVVLVGAVLVEVEEPEDGSLPAGWSTVGSVWV